MFLNNEDGMFFAGSIDANGNATFTQANIFFDLYEDGRGYRTQLQPLDAGTGTFCPNSGAATITFPARIRVTKVAGTSITSQPCYIPINGEVAFTLTTGTSGSLTGTDFTQLHPKLVATITLGEATNCTQTHQTTVNTYYGLQNTTATVIMEDAAITPNNFTGTGC